MGESLAIGYVHPGHVDAHFMQSVLGLVAADHQRKTPRILDNGTSIAVGSGPRIAEARNTVVEYFLKSSAEWLLMVDTDMMFSPDMVDKIMDAADPTDAPIVGGLCFGGGRSGIMFPTMYRLVKPEHEGDSPVEVIEDYPEDALCQVHATGAAFLLIHRGVLEQMGETYKGSPYPWFLEGSVYKGTKFGEDWAFCMRAIEAGYKIHVHTGVKIGHVKPQVLDEDSWLAFKARKAEIGEAGVAQQFKAKLMGGEQPAPKAPTYVIIPQKGKVHLTQALLAQLHRQGGVDGIYVFDNGSTNEEFDFTDRQCEQYGATLISADGRTIHQMWNEGVGRILSRVDGPVNIAILNNDIRIGPHFLLRQATALRADQQLAAVCPNYDGRKGSGVKYVTGNCGRGGMSGFAFMFAGERYRNRQPFDEDLTWWYGDDAFALGILDDGMKIGIVLGASVEHIHGGSQTSGPDVTQWVAKDRAVFAEKYGFAENESGQLVRGAV